MILQITTMYPDAYPTLTKAYHALAHLKACKQVFERLRLLLKKTRVFTIVRNAFIQEWASSAGGLALCQNMFKLKSERRIQQIRQKVDADEPVQCSTRLREDPQLWIKSLEQNLI